MVAMFFCVASTIPYRNITNANQLAKAANSGYGANRDDVAEVNQQLTELRTQFGDMLSSLSDVANAKPGKRFIPPPKITGFIDEPEQIEQPDDEKGAEPEPPSVGEGS